jgi:hypothetical protein
MKKKGKKNPEIGDTIRHHVPYFDKTYEGTIIQMLSMQFVYETEEGDTRFCMFKEDWTHIS